MTDSQKLMKENIEKNKEQNKELCKRYPYLALRDSFTNELIKDYDYSTTYADLELPTGWKKLFLQLCEDILQPLTDSGLLNEFCFLQVKEKFGELRVYASNCPEEVNTIINKYEYVSQFVCERCGQPATKETNGWISHYCDECFKLSMWRNKENEYNESELINKFKNIKYNPIATFIRYGSDSIKRTISLDCSDIFERLYKKE